MHHVVVSLDKFCVVDTIAHIIVVYIAIVHIICIVVVDNDAVPLQVLSIVHFVIVIVVIDLKEEIIGFFQYLDCL